MGPAIHLCWSAGGVHEAHTRGADIGRIQSTDEQLVVSPGGREHLLVQLQRFH